MSTPTNPQNTPTPPPLPGVQLTNPDRLPGEEVPVNPDAKAPEGTSTGAQIPAHWKPGMTFTDGKVAVKALIESIKAQVELLEAVISRMG